MQAFKGIEPSLASLALLALVMGGAWLSGFPPTHAGPGLQPAAPPAAAGTVGDAPPPREAHRPPTDEELDRMVKSGFASEVKVDRVRVPAVVFDRKGRPVHGLKPADFVLLEDTVRQKIDYFDVDLEERISVSFLLDVSGSMRLLDKIGEAREAIQHFLASMRPQDRAQLMVFADGQVQTLAPFGVAPHVLRAQLAAAKAYGQTALNDALAAAPGIVDADKSERKAIVLITDGVDNFSHITLQDAMATARRVDVPVYSIAFSGEPAALKLDIEAEGTNVEVLKRISEETGGRFFLIHDPDDLKEAILAVEEDLRSQYVLGYTPPRTVCNGAFRRIELKVEKDRYRVRSRKGYFAGPC